jgi:GLPGLI family protein
MNYLNKTILTISFLFITINLYSQYELTYLYEFKKDSVRKKTNTDFMNVIIDGDNHIYRGESHIMYDSITYTKKKIDGNNINSVLKETMELKKVVDNYSLELDLDKGIEKHYVYNLELPFYYEKKIELPRWNLINDILEIDGKKLKKATTTFLGRNWIAYYSEELPIQAAPYLFYGLPGSIVKLHDENNNFKFELIKIKSKTDFSNLYETMISKRRTDFVKMNKDEVYKLGKSLQQNMTNILIESGLQLTEEEIKIRQEKEKKRKYIYLNPNIPFYL